MEKLKSLLIANRGEIAARICKTAKRLNIHTVAIYTDTNSASAHVTAADEAVILSGPESEAYLDGEQIVQIAKSRKVDVIIPGYGFLSENAGFARQVSEAGMVFAGPSPESIESFGIKHTARQLAERDDAPIVPGTHGLVNSEDEAVLSYHAGMRLLICASEKEVRDCFRAVQSRGETLFKNSGLFIERFYPSSRHIEVQVFGNGQAKRSTLAKENAQSRDGIRRSLRSAQVHLLRSMKD